MINRRGILVCMIGFCMLLVLFFFWGSNGYTELVFSHEAGFYDEPFELKLYAPTGTEIYYTLDGAEPDENAIKYTAPIWIDDASTHDNVYSMRTDLGMDSSRIPDGTIDKCTVVRAVYIDSEGNASEIKTKSYFVGYSDKSGYNDLNIISIVTDPKNLFDYDTGIYVTGKWDANFLQRGIEWERDASIEIFNADRVLLVNKECGIRIQGGASRHNVPKSIKIYARKQYDGDGRFYLDLFDTGYAADTVTLFAGGNDYEGIMRDMLTARLVKDRQFATMNYKPYVMFLDGEYWGCYWLTEKYDDTFIEYYYGVKKDNIIMVKSGSIAEGKEEDIELYSEMSTYLKRTDFTIPENYEHACELMDMQSFIDYFAVEIYIGRQSDWPSGNTALWRARETGNGEYEDGKWRWMLFDVNGDVLYTNLIEVDTLAYVMDQSSMFRSLCQNEEFKKQFTITFMDLANEIFQERHINPVIAYHRELMTEPMRKHWGRFLGGEEYFESFHTAIWEVETFLYNRRPYITKCLKEDLGLNGSLAAVEIEINDDAAGAITVNTITVSFEDGKWTGEYYTDYPIELTAVANPGYRFAGWEEDVVSNEEHVTIGVEKRGISIRAVFEKVY